MEAIKIFLNDDVFSGGGANGESCGHKTDRLHPSFKSTGL